MSNQLPLKQTRNIGIMAHIDAGKTTTTERILFYTGSTYKIGEVHDGDTVMDWMVQEQERGITITSAATTCHWQDHRINIIDTPGHVDFTVEVERCLRILDGAIFLLDAKEGVEAQTEAVWHQSEHYEVPRLVFVNKMDVIGADYHQAIDDIKTVLKGNPLPIQLPMGAEKDYVGIISLVEMKAYYFQGEHGEIVKASPIPDAYRQRADQHRNALIETLADTDDALMIKYLEGEPITIDEIKSAIRHATLNNTIAPVLCGSAYKNKGIQLLLDAILDYLPSPLDCPEIHGHTSDGTLVKRAPAYEAPFSGLIFKVISDPYAGRLAYMRIYSGHIKTGGAVMNVSKHKKERILKLLAMHANTRTEIDIASAGDIVAAIGLKFSTTGDTLADMNDPLLLESIDFPEPVISRALEPRTPADYDKMVDALQRLTEEDPTLVTKVHPDTGQTLLSGMGELHLEIILDRLVKEFNVNVNSGKPQVTYKESIFKPVTVEHQLSKMAGTQMMFAYVKLNVKPKERGAGHTIVVNLHKKQIPKQYLDAACEGIEQSLQSGILGGYEVIDLDVEICDVNFDEEHSSEVAFKTAASYAITSALKKGDSKLLEPIFNVSVQVSEEYLGDVIDDMNRRGGTIIHMGHHAAGSLIKATAPLSKLFGYATDLRSITRGHAHYTLLFSHFDHVD